MELSTVYRRNQRVISRKIVDELILVPVRESVVEMERLYTLNDVAARIYELIDGERSVGDIADAIASEFEVTLEEARTDVSGFLEQLLSIEGIDAVEG